MQSLIYCADLPFNIFILLIQVGFYSLGSGLKAYIVDLVLVLFLLAVKLFKLGVVPEFFNLIIIKLNRCASIS